eukprot:Rhum_TRINITY_DN14095_c7_g1::Rhum_TRINITY_DN14095_c7_g1_i1::g.68891::m.68891
MASNPPPAKRQKRRDDSGSAREAAAPGLSKEMKKTLQKVLTAMIDADTHGVFHYPVEGVEGYSDVITHPMDFSTMQKKLQDGGYEGADEFESDLALCFTNCMTFNPDDSFWFLEAVRLHKHMAATVFPAHGLVAEVYVPYEKAMDDVATLLEEDAAEAREFGGDVEKAREVTVAEEKQCKDYALRPLKDVLREFGDAEAIVRASKNLTKRAREQKEGLDVTSAKKVAEEDDSSSSSSGSSSDEEEEEDEEDEEGDEE